MDEESLSKELQAALRVADSLNADNRHNDHCTAEPMFCLQYKVRDVGYDSAYSANECWWNPGDMEVVYDEAPKDLTGWEGPFGYKDRWETIMVAFTQEGLDGYMRQNGHNVQRRAFNSEVRTFVDTFYRCDEMIALRNFLMCELEGLAQSALRWEKGPAEGGQGTAGSEAGISQWWDGDRLLVVINNADGGRDCHLVHVMADGDVSFRDTITGDYLDIPPDEIAWWSKVGDSLLPSLEKSTEDEQ